MLKVKNKLDVKKQFKFDLKMKLILMGVFCCLLIFVFYLFSANYHSGKSSSTILQAAFLKDSFKSKYQYLVNLQLAAKEVDSLKKEINEIQSQMLPFTTTSAAMDEISQLGNEEHLSFIYFKPKNPEIYKNFKITPINTSVSGQYQDMIDFLYKIASVKGTVVVKQFTFMKHGKDGNEVILNAQINVYSAVENKKPAGSKK